MKQDPSSALEADVLGEEVAVTGNLTVRVEQLQGTPPSTLRIDPVV